MPELSIRRKREMSEESGGTPARKRGHVEETDRSNPWARWCSVWDDDTYVIDETRVRNLLPKISEDKPSIEIMSDIVSGMVISGQVHPLIFEDGEVESVRLRSLAFFSELVHDVEKGKETYQALSAEKKRTVSVGVRDLYLATWQGHADDREGRLLKGMIKVIDGFIETSQAQGMELSYCPSASLRASKFVEDLDRQIDRDLVPCYAQILDKPRLFVVFVDAAELSYHNFENIIPLDRWIEAREQALELSLEAFEQPKAGREVFTCKLKGPAGSSLKALSSLDLFKTPLNKETRGGERFIFHSNLLSKALTEGVRRSGILGQIATGKLEKGFEFVNYVFRCNRFAPGDKRFTSHRDTPYYDRARLHVSKYTILIYLTSGKGEPALHVDDIWLYDVEEMTCVIFDQSLEHEGRPFIDVKKVFVRSELIFKDESLLHDDRIAPLFSSACYLTGQGVFGEDLAAYANQCFERANALHWAIEQDIPEPPVYLVKTFRDAQFVTNGYDYWFRRGAAAGMELEGCAMLAVLDYLNCKIGDSPFRSLCCAKAVRRRIRSTAEVWELLRPDEDQAAERCQALKPLTDADIDNLVQGDPHEPLSPREIYPGDSPSQLQDELDSGWPCCPFHFRLTFDAWKNEEVLDEYRKCWEDTRKQLFDVPLVMLGQQMFINKSQILVERDKIFILRAQDTKGLPPLNFAACWISVHPLSPIISSEEVKTPEFLIPPILFREDGHVWHLVMDLFQNDWIVSVDNERSIPLPVITNDMDGWKYGDTAWEEAQSRDEKSRGIPMATNGTDDSKDEETASDDASCKLPGDHDSSWQWSDFEAFKDEPFV
ncbi:hypothetical protein BDW74DRAFT_8349 [Aspergillus multicolor]|uniref:uncharacterized protein n=1 Tax=Aspergillus multicolor TaxID=41759 RepID=UPI003CCDED82